MDIFTNYILSGVLTLAVWAIGAIVVHFVNPETTAYITWLKIWAIAAAFIATGFSLILTGIFPDPASQDITKMLTSI